MVIDYRSFAFRAACYERFGWDVEQVRMLPEMEAARLAVYFEEETKHARKEADKAKASDESDAYDTSRTVLELSDGEGEEYAFEDIEDDEDGE